MKSRQIFKSQLIIFTISVLNIVQATATTSDSAKYKSPYESALYSLIVPGVGQFYNEEYGKGALFLGLTCANIILLLNADNFELNASFNRKQDNDNHELKRSLTYLTLGVWVYQLIDAPVSSCIINNENQEKIKKKDIGFIDDNAKLNIYPDFGMKSIGLAVTYHF